MRILLPTLSLVTLLGFIAPQSGEAGGTGYSHFKRKGCAESKWSTPRLSQSLPFRHYEDRRRYNAAPHCGEPHVRQTHLLKTVIVRKKYEPYYTYDSRGNRHCRHVLVVTYKDIYSDGSCRVYTSRS